MPHSEHAVAGRPGPGADASLGPAPDMVDVPPPAPRAPDALQTHPCCVVGCYDVNGDSCCCLPPLCYVGCCMDGPLGVRHEYTSCGGCSCGEGRRVRPGCEVPCLLSCLLWPCCFLAAWLLALCTHGSCPGRVLVGSCWLGVLDGACAGPGYEEQQWGYDEWGHCGACFVCCGTPCP
jgi:hypothetical protein